MIYGAKFHPGHLADLRKSGLSDESIDMMGAYSLRPADIPREIGWNPEGVESVLAIPYPGLDFSRFKVFPAFQDTKGHKVKYLQRKDTGVHLYILPPVQAALLNPSSPLYFTEGEKKAAKAVQEGLKCIGLGGLWNWIEKETGEVIKEIDSIPLVNREIGVVPDSDIWGRADLQKAIFAFGKELEERGAKVSFIVISQIGGEKVGLDDLLVKGGLEIFNRLDRINLKHNTMKRHLEWLKGWKREREERRLISLSQNTTNRPEMGEGERKEAIDFLKNPELLLQVQEDLAMMGIVGENRVKVVAYLIATARKMPPGRSLAGTFKAGSSGGKSHIVRTVASLMPEEEVKEFTHLSPKALYYFGEDGVRNKLIICTEIAGREEAEYAIRNLISEPFITSTIPTRSHDGGPPKTQEFKVNGPIAYLETTTNLQLNPENATRLFELYLDEEEAQTKAINVQQAREFGVEGFAIQRQRDEGKRVHRNAQRLLITDLQVVIPFADLIQFPSRERRARRDFPKLLNLIAVIAFFHQYQREIKEKDGQKYLEASDDDYELAYHLAKETFVETLDVLDKRSRDVLEKVKEELEKQGEEEGRCASELEFDRNTVSKWTNRRKEHLIPIFKELERKEYFLDKNDGQATQKKVYTINQELANSEKVRFGFSGLTTPEELRELWGQRPAQVAQVESVKISIS